MKVLIVDDSKTMRGIQKRILKKAGHKDITEAENGLEAKAAVEKEMPELILLDWNMPEMDGLEFLREFRPENPFVPVIMITTEAEKIRVIEAIKAGINNYIIKPFTPDVLTDRIEETLETTKTAAATAAEAEEPSTAEETDAEEEPKGEKAPEESDAGEDPKAEEEESDAA